MMNYAEKLHTIQAVVCDIDGTLLLPGEQTLQSSTVDVIKHLKEVGIDFVFASGRLPSRINPLIHQIDDGDSTFVVSCNGALVCYKNKIVFKDTFKDDLVKALVEKADALDMTVLYSTDGVEYCHRETPDSSRKRLVRGSYAEVKPIDFSRSHFIKLNVLGLNCSNLLADELEKLEKTMNVTHYGSDGVEIVNAQVNKSTGVKLYCKLMQRPFSKIMAIGDNENDIELFRRSGLAVAVANATDEAKENADCVTKSRAALGVEEALTKLLDTVADSS